MKDDNANLESFFNQVKEKLKQEWANAYLDQSYIQAIGDEFNYMMLACSFEKKHLNKALESYTFDKFTAQLNQIFKTGRYLWFFSGNVAPETAISTVESIRSNFTLQGIEILDTVEVRPIALEAGRALALESPLTAETNNNSCAVTCFEIGLLKGNIELGL